MFNFFKKIKKTQCTWPPEAFEDDLQGIDDEYLIWTNARQVNSIIKCAMRVCCMELGNPYRTSLEKQNFKGIDVSHRPRLRCYQCKELLNFLSQYLVFSADINEVGELIELNQYKLDYRKNLHTTQILSLVKKGQWLNRNGN